MAALWYNLPNICHQFCRIIPLSTAAGEEIGFVHVERQQLHPLKKTTTSAHLPTPPFLVSHPLFLSHSVVGRSPWIIHQCEMKKLMDIEYPLWSGGQPCVFFSFFFFFFFLQLKRVKSGRSHCQGISKVNRLLYLAHIFTFFMVCGRRGGVAEMEWMKKKIEKESRWKE